MKGESRMTITQTDALAARVHDAVAPLGGTAQEHHTGGGCTALLVRIDGTHADGTAWELLITDGDSQVPLSQSLLTVHASAERWHDTDVESVTLHESTHDSAAEVIDAVVNIATDWVDKHRA